MPSSLQDLGTSTASLAPPQTHYHAFLCLIHNTAATQHHLHAHVQPQFLQLVKLQTSPDIIFASAKADELLLEALKRPLDVDTDGVLKL